MIGRSAKSHQYYYYACNGSLKQGGDACNARALPKDKLERLVIEQVKHRVLNQQWLEELVELVNMEVDSRHDILKERLDVIDAELNDMKIKLSKLYDALETDKLSLDDLAPRIKEIRSQQDELGKTRLLLEAEKATRVVKHVDVETVKAYARDLQRLLGEADFLESKAFLRSFVKRIEIDGGSAKVHYILPMPPDGKMRESLGVLPMVTFGGAEGIRTPDLLLAKQALSRLSYSPNVNYCIKYCVAVKALGYRVYGIAAILKRGYIDAKLLSGSRLRDSILCITLYLTPGPGLSGQHSWCISPYSRPC
jgi:site-specific DNA recombinase